MLSVWRRYTNASMTSSITIRLWYHLYPYECIENQRLKRGDGMTGDTVTTTGQKGAFQRPCWRAWCPFTIVEAIINLNGIR